MTTQPKQLPATPDKTETDDVATAIVVPPLPKQEILERFNKIQDLKRSLINPKTDIVSIAGRRFITKSGWRKLAFNLTDEIAREEREKKETKTVWRMWVRVRAPNGRETVGVASASSDERKFSHPEHDVYALCHTRAKNRGFSDILGLGEVSAEETSADTDATETSIPPRDQPGTTHQADIPPSVGTSPDVAAIVWKVPKIKDQASPEQVREGLKQVPLLKGTQSFGMINISGDQISLVPERPVLTDTALIDDFLIRRVLEPMQQKHNLEFTVETTPAGQLTAILIRGVLGDKQFRELVNGARWAFGKSIENHEATSSQQAKKTSNNMGKNPTKTPG